MNDRGDLPRSRVDEPGSVECVVLEPGAMAIGTSEFVRAIQMIADGRIAELARDRNGICYRVALARKSGGTSALIVKVPRPGPQRSNPDATFAWEASVLASLHAAGIPGAPLLGGRVAHGATHYLFTAEVPGKHPNPLTQPLDRRHLRAIRDHLYAMDTRAFMHYDLKLANILIADAQAGFIDFEFAQFLDFGDVYSSANGSSCEDFNVSINPFFPTHSNVANFEFRALDHYLKGIESDAAASTALVGDWLREKSEYHRKMAAFVAGFGEGMLEAMALKSGLAAAAVRENLRESAYHEVMLAQLFESPGEVVVRIERLVMAYRNAVFEREAENALRLRQTTLALIERDTAQASIPAAYRKSVQRVLHLVGRSDNHR